MEKSPKCFFPYANRRFRSTLNAGTNPLCTEKGSYKGESQEMRIFEKAV